MASSEGAAPAGGRPFGVFGRSRRDWPGPRGAAHNGGTAPAGEPGKGTRGPTRAARGSAGAGPLPAG